MSFTDLFIKRPVLAIVVTLVIIIAGLQAVSTLSVRQYPRLERATIEISTVYVGADADLVRGFISTPIEREFRSSSPCHVETPACQARLSSPTSWLMRPSSQTM